MRLARRMLERNQIGRIHHSRFFYHDEAYLDDSLPYAWRMDRRRSGRGVLSDIGSHAIDLARFLMGEITGASGYTRTVVTERSGRRVEVPDVILGHLHFEDGSIAELSASSLSTGAKNSLGFEIRGEKGALRWDLQRLNELEVYRLEDRAGGRSGFCPVYVSSVDHPDLIRWPPGEHPVGIDISYLLEIHRLIECIASGKPVGPDGSDFHGGLRVEMICDALERSSLESGRLVPVEG